MLFQKKTYEIRKFYNLEEVNKLLVEENEMEAYTQVWEFAGCGSESKPDGSVQPYYLLAKVLYDKGNF